MKFHSCLTDVFYYEYDFNDQSRNSIFVKKTIKSPFFPLSHSFDDITIEIL